MAAEFKLAGAFVEIRANERPLQASLARLRTSIGDQLRSISTSAGSVFQGMVGAQMFAGMVEGAKNLGWSLIGASAGMEQAKISLEVLTGSTEKTKRLLKELTEFAIRTPFQMPQLLKATNLLLAFGFEVKDVMPLIKTLGEAASASHLGMEEGMHRVIIAIGQMRGKQRVMTQEMNQLTEAGIPAWDFLAKAIGTDVAGAMKKVELGAVSANVGINSILTGIEGKFGGVMQKQSKTFTGLVSTMIDATRFLGIEVGEPFFNAAKQGVIRVIEFLGSTSGQEWAGAFRQAISSITGVLVESGKVFGSFFDTLTKFSGIKTFIAYFALLAPVVAAAVIGLTAMKFVVAPLAGIFLSLVSPLGIIVGLLGAGAIQSASGAFQRVTGFVQENKQVFAEWGEKLIEIGRNVSQAIGGIFREIGKVFDDVFTIISSKTTVTWNDIKKAITSTLDTISYYTFDMSKTWQIALLEMEKAWISFSTLITERGPNAIVQAGDASLLVVKGLFESAKALLTGGDPDKAFNKVFEDNAIPLVNKWDAAAAEATRKINARLEEVNAKIRTVGEGLDKAFNADRAQTKIMNLFEAWKEQAIGLGKTLADVFMNIGGNRGGLKIADAKPESTFKPQFFGSLELAKKVQESEGANKQVKNQEKQIEQAKQANKLLEAIAGKKAGLGVVGE